ncbi:uncharacterized protein LOC144215780 [Stigmatopora nigra]
MTSVSLIRRWRTISAPKMVHLWRRQYGMIMKIVEKAITVIVLQDILISTLIQRNCQRHDTPEWKPNGKRCVFDRLVSPLHADVVTSWKMKQLSNQNCFTMWLQRHWHSKKTLDLLKEEEEEKPKNTFVFNSDFFIFHQSQENPSSKDAEYGAE